MSEPFTVRVAIDGDFVLSGPALITAAVRRIQAGVDQAARRRGLRAGHPKWRVIHNFEQPRKLMVLLEFPALIAPEEPPKLAERL